MLGHQAEGHGERLGDVGQLAQAAPVAPSGACRCVGRSRRRLVRPGSAAPRPGAGRGAVEAIAPFAESCIRKAVAERGLTPDLVGLADTKAEDEAATGTAFALRGDLY